MRSQPSSNRPPHRRKLRCELLEIRAYPGALLWWGAGFAGVGVADAVAQPAETPPFDASSAARERIRGSKVDSNAVHTPASAALDAALALLASRADANTRSAQPTDNTIKHFSNAVPRSHSALSIDWAALGVFGAHNPARHETPDPILTPPLRETPSTPPTGNTGGGASHRGGDTASLPAVATGGSPVVPDATRGGSVAALPAPIATGEPPVATEGATAAPELALVDAAGQPFDVAPDANGTNANTLFIAAATWCGASALLKRELLAPGVMNQLAGLRLVFAFTDEGGSGPGGVEDAEFLADLPGDVAFLPRASVQPTRFPMTFNSNTGQFDRSPYDAIHQWAAADNPAQPPNLFSDIAKPKGCTRSAPAVATGGSPVADHVTTGGPPVATNSGAVTAEPAVTTSSGGGSGDSLIPGDYNDDFRVNAADYTVWRDTLGQTGPDLAADGSGNQLVDQADYGLWQAQSGEMGSAPGAFTITGPLGIQATEDSVVTWTPSAGATSYHFVLSQQSDLSFPLYDELVATNSKAVNLGGGQRYYIGVTAINPIGATAADNQGFSTAVYESPVDQLIFVTSASFAVSDTSNYPPSPSSFGSALATDYHCTALASAAGILEEPWDSETLYFKALITQSSTDLVDRVSLTNDTYYNVDGIVVAATLPELLSGNWSAPVLDQNGETLLGEQLVWTGALADSSASNRKCINWTDPTGTAHVGNLNGAGTDKISDHFIGCMNQARLYCVGTRAVELNLLKDVNPFSAPSDAADFTPAGDLTYFTATDGTHGRELWVTDGVPGGAETRMVKDINQGPGSGTREIYDFSMAYVNGELFFSATMADHLAAELWKTDGTEEGTVQVNQTSVELLPVQLTAVGDTLFFAAQDETNRQQLWKSDGTDAGTVPLTDFNLGGEHSLQHMTVVGNTLYFTMDDTGVAGGDHGRELWKSDGTEAGTEMVVDLIDGETSSIPEMLTDVDGTLYFVAGFDGDSLQLWKTGGTSATTQFVKELSFDANYITHLSLTNVAGTLFFFDVSGSQLWTTSEADGTTLVADFSFPGFQRTEVAHAGGLFYFQHVDQESGVELWKSDGTLAGTTIVKDIVPANVELGNSYPTHLTNIGGTLYFSANDHVNASSCGAPTARRLVLAASPTWPPAPQAATPSPTPARAS